MEVPSKISKTFAASLGRSLMLVGHDDTSPLVSVVCSQWDSSIDRFLRPRKWFIPSSGGAEVLSVQAVSSYESGMIEVYVVLATRSVLKVGMLDVSDEAFVLTAEVPLPREFSQGGPSFECLLGDGPSVVVSNQNKVLVIHPRGSGMGSSSVELTKDALTSTPTEVDHQWCSYTVSFDGFREGADVKLLLICEENNESGSFVVLGIRSDCLDSSSRGFQWQYIRFHLYIYSHRVENVHQDDRFHKPAQTWKRIYQNSDYVFCDGLFPSDLNPFAISCIHLIPANPSFLSSVVMGLDTDQSKHSLDLIIATNDKRVLKCRHGKIIAAICLQDIALQITFSVLSGGQGVLIAQLSGAQRSIGVLCAETLEELKVWRNVAHVAVGDYQLSGHEQIVLLNFRSHGQPNLTSLESLLDSVYMTDFRKSGFVGMTDQQQEMKYSGNSMSIESKNRHLQSIVKVLEARIESGNVQEKRLEAMMKEKKWLIKSSCSRFKEMMERSLIASFEQCEFLTNECSKNIANGGINFCEIKEAYHGLHGENWVLVTSVQTQVPGGVILDGATLLLTAIQGQIAECTSSVNRIDSEDEVYQFVIKVPLKRFYVFSCLPSLNVLLKAWITHKNGVHQQSAKDEDIHCSVKPKINTYLDERHRYLYTQWLGRICIKPEDLLRKLSQNGSYSIMSVGESRFFILKPIAVHSLSNLLQELKSVFCMDLCNQEKSDSKMSEGKNYKLVSKCICPQQYVYVDLFKDVALATLCAEDYEVLSRMEALLLFHFQNQYEICRSATLEDMLGAVLVLSRKLLRDIGFEDIALKSDHPTLYDESSMNHIADAGLSIDECLPYLIPH